ncbi:MAG TPA: VOC family protein [Sandaracinaceae bacterium]
MNEAIRIDRLASVILSVTDQDRAIDFYVGTLGMQKVADLPYGDGERWVEVAPAGAATTIALARPPQSVEPQRGGSCISFEVDDVNAMHAQLRERGVDVDPEVLRLPPPVPAMFFFRDPDGNPLLIVERSRERA